MERSFNLNNCLTQPPLSIPPFLTYSDLMDQLPSFYIPPIKILIYNLI